MATVTVTHRNGGVYDVMVDDGRGTSSHEVTVGPSDVERYAPGSTPENLLRASFQFLLECEPKESILRTFDLSVIERYFPEFPRIIRQR